MQLFFIVTGSLIALCLLLMAYIVWGYLIHDLMCKFGWHSRPKNKYYCLHCREGRGTLTVIDGAKPFYKERPR